MKKVFRLSQKSPLFWALLLTTIIILSLSTAFYLNERDKTKEKREEYRRQTEIASDEGLGEITEFSIEIHKLGIEVPVIPNVDGKDEGMYNKALEEGVAHYLNTALPDSGSNIVIFGHSSTILGKGEYSEVFAGLNDLKVGDRVTLSLNNTSYPYNVTEKKIVAANDTSVLSGTEDEQLTLLTCWPVGTDAKRLVVIAKPSYNGSTISLIRLPFST